MIKSHDNVGNFVQESMSTYVGSIKMAIIYPPYKSKSSEMLACLHVTTEPFETLLLRAG